MAHRLEVISSLSLELSRVKLEDWRPPKRAEGSKLHPFHMQKGHGIGVLNQNQVCN